MTSFSLPQNLTKFCARAKYIPQPDGSLRLAMVQSFSRPNFRPSGWEDRKKPPQYIDELYDNLEESANREHVGAADDIERATRRAKINAFDIIQCNPDLDTFCTFTYAPDTVADKSSYDDCYAKLAPWLSNRVQRTDLKYVLVPERHKSGDIHFHSIMNSSALHLSEARSPKTGRLLKNHGRQVYNVSDWKNGFTTAEIIGGTLDDRDAVAKYVFKYMGKQLGAKIGGRYALIGGKLLRPIYQYGDTAEEFLDGRDVKYDREVHIGDGLTYKEYSLV